MSQIQLYKCSSYVLEKRQKAVSMQLKTKSLIFNQINPASVPFLLIFDSLIDSSHMCLSRLAWSWAKSMSDLSHLTHTLSSIATHTYIQCKSMTAASSPHEPTDYPGEPQCHAFFSNAQKVLKVAWQTIEPYWIICPLLTINRVSVFSSLSFSLSLSSLSRSLSLSLYILYLPLFPLTDSSMTLVLMRTFKADAQYKCAQRDRRFTSLTIVNPLSVLSLRLYLCTSSFFLTNKPRCDWCLNRPALTHR